MFVTSMRNSIDELGHYSKLAIIQYEHMTYSQMFGENGDDGHSLFSFLSSMSSVPQSR